MRPIEWIVGLYLHWRMYWSLRRLKHILEERNETD